MSKPPKCGATFLKKFRSIYVGHLGLQNVAYQVDTPCREVNPQKWRASYCLCFGS